MSFEKIAGLQAAGGFELPAELLEAESERIRLYKAANVLRMSRNNGMFDGTAAGDLHNDKVRIADNAAESADNKVRGYCKGNVDEILCEVLRPAFEAVLAETRKCTHKTTPTTAEAAVAGSDKGVTEYRRAAGLVTRFVAIKAAAQELYMTNGYGPGGRDTWSLFADTRRYPKGSPGQYAFIEPAGPSDPTARLLWLAHETEAAYLPTNAERDELLNLFQRHDRSAGSSEHDWAVND